MSMYCISRHPGARDWAAEDIAVDEFVIHLDMARVRGDNA